MSTEAEEERRPRRQAARNKIYTESNVLKCNPANFVGYVEDLETPEMIMRKFQALEEFQAEQDAAKKENEDGTSGGKKKKKAGEDAMTEEELQEVFRRTSAFSAASVVAPTHNSGQLTMIPAEDEDGEMEYFYFDDGWDMTGMDQEEDEDGGAFFVCRGEDDEEYYSDEEDELWGRITSGKASSGKKRQRAAAPEKVKKKRSESPSDEPQLPNLSRARQTLLKRVRRRKPTDPNAISFVRIPNDPVPSSWAKRVIQYVPPACTHVHTFWTSEDVLMPRSAKLSDEPAALGKNVKASSALSLKPLLLNLAKDCEGFHGVVLNPPWKEPRPGAAPLEKGIVPEDLLDLPLADNDFMPAGFVYIWTPKHWLHRTLQALEKMDLHYVENAVVVNERVGDGPPLSQPCTYFSQQKETLLVCRRGVKHAVSGKLNWAPIELRHQRISDVHLACYRPSALRADIPEKPFYYVHKMAETMLPASRYNADLPEVKPRLCEIWAGSGSTRSGWVMVNVDV